MAIDQGEENPTLLFTDDVLAAVDVLKIRYKGDQRVALLLAAYFLLRLKADRGHFSNIFEDLAACIILLWKVPPRQRLHEADRLMKQFIMPVAEEAVMLLIDGEHPAPDYLGSSSAVLDIARSIVPDSDPAYCQLQQYLALFHQFRFAAYGDSDDLDASIGFGREIIANSNSSTDLRAAARSNLAGTLLKRFEKFGEMQDLEEAINCGNLAISETSATHHERAGRLSNLANALATKYGRLGDVHDLEESILLLEQAVEILDDTHRDLPGRLSNLAGVKRRRYLDFGDRNDIDETIILLRKAEALLQDGHRDKAMFQSNLGAALQIRFDHHEDDADLQEGIAFKRAAVARSSSDSPQRISYTSNLADSLQARFELLHDAEDAEESLRLAKVVVFSPLESTWFRCKAASRAAMFAAEHGYKDIAATMARTAVKLVSELSSGEVTIRSTQELLSRVSGLASDMTAVALQCNDAPAALSYFDQARTVRLNQVLSHRAELAQLERALPERVSEFTELRRSLDSELPYFEVTYPVDPVVERRQSAAQWKSLLNEIRLHPDLKEFLNPPSATDLCSGVGSDPVVIINTSRLRCDAVILQDRTLSVVELPGLMQEAIDNAERWVAAVKDLDNEAITEILAWMWSAFAERIVRNLGIDQQDSEKSDRQRVWWIPTGPLTVLPIHAAAPLSHDGVRSLDLLDLVVSSYATTVSGLVKLKQQSEAEFRTERALIAGVTEVSSELNFLESLGLRPLPYARLEAESVASLYEAQPLLNEAAESNAFSSRLPAADLVHIACHGVIDLLDPSRSGILLYDGVLPASTLIEQDLRSLGLVFLSACETANFGRKLVDEAISVSTAFQVAGARNVIGTLWPISDGPGSEFATAYHRELMSPRSPDPGSAAVTLNKVVRVHRDRYPDGPWHWAGYIHFGV